MISAALICHPASACAPITTFSAQLDRPAADRLKVRFRIDGAIDQLLIPRNAAPRRVDGLWKHTCVEVFLKAEGSSAYHEFNFSPSGEWAAYRFDSYRSGMTAAVVDDAPRIATTTAADQLLIDVEIALPADLGAPEPLFSLSAVIEDRSARISYWAVAHAPHKPDFHHDNGFVLRLPPRGGAAI
jgi:hypothetical protein